MIVAEDFPYIRPKYFRETCEIIGEPDRKIAKSNTSKPARADSKHIMGEIVPLAVRSPINPTSAVTEDGEV